MKSPIEFHFQEVFTGERIEIIAGGEVRARFEARTRFQTGLAHIERLQLDNDEEVTISIEDSSLTSTLRVDVTRPFVTIKMTDGHLHVDITAMRPGYL